MLVWVVGWLLVLDLAASVLFRYPDDPRNLSPSWLQLYFDYGRSMEGRLRRATRADPAETAPITLAGWYQPLTSLTRPGDGAGPTVTVYGMSHAVRLADALDRVSERYRVRSVGAPGAATNWSYGAFLRDRELQEGDVVVLAYMASNLPMITSMSAMTWNNSFAMPYTSDRFVLRHGKLAVVHPPYESFEDYVRTFRAPAAWAAAKAVIARHDPFFDPLLFNETVLDRSTLVRLARRARSQSRDRKWRTQALSGSHFVANSEPILLANAIAADFAVKARSAGLIPVVYIVNNRGYGNQLSLALQGTLHLHRIPYVDSAAFVDPMNPRNYLPDNHFTDANDELLARALESIIEREMLARAADQAPPIG